MPPGQPPAETNGLLAPTAAPAPLKWPLCEKNELWASWAAAGRFLGDCMSAAELAGRGKASRMVLGARQAEGVRSGAKGD